MTSVTEDVASDVEIEKFTSHLKFEGLSVMNVLGSLKHSEQSDNGKFYQNNAISLPNLLDLPEEYTFKRVKDRKNFFEEVSSKSSNAVNKIDFRKKTRFFIKGDSQEGSVWESKENTSQRSSLDDICDLQKSEDELMSNDSNSIQYSTEDESMSFSLPSNTSDTNCPISVKEKKFFWEQISPRSDSSVSNKSEKGYKKTDETNSILEKSDDRLRNNLIDKTGGIYKSDNNLLSLENSCDNSLKKYKSVDDSLDNCTTLSIQERKKMLLKQDYFKDKHEKAEAKLKPLKWNNKTVEHQTSMTKENTKKEKHGK